MRPFRHLTREEIQQATRQACRAQDWQKIRVDPAFDVNRLQDVHFLGAVTIGKNAGVITVGEIQRPCGIHHAIISDCDIEDDVLISGVHDAIHNYRIGARSVLLNVHALIADQAAACGCGVKVSVLNEAGGREVTLFPGLNAQLAYLQAIHKHDAPFQGALEQLLRDQIEAMRSAKGIIADHVQICDAGVIKNVHIGAHAVVHGVSELSDGTILSCPEDPVFIGPNTICRSFIICEGAHISDGAVLDHVFVGQACRVGKTFSGENTLLFANCEAFHSEACSIFAAPYSVTHHRSTLLIACLFSFYNAGSGSNQSNHMYKLGPVHQGVLERGCKTGSFSYLLLESHIPAFTVIIGKHMANFDLGDFPFSYIADEGGRSMIIPGKNLFSIGTVRDAAKWPARDRRKAPLKRDLIHFDVFSPYTVAKMRRGRDTLQKLYAETPKESDSLHLGGAVIKRLLLRKGAKYYELAIDRYLIGKLLSAIEVNLDAGLTLEAALAALPEAKPLQQPDHWLDIAGVLVTGERYQQLMHDVSDRSITTLEQLLDRLTGLHAAYQSDEWSYICHAFAQEYGISLHALQAAPLRELVERWQNAASSLQALILADAKIEFADFAHIGYGLTAAAGEKTEDFIQVRGSLESNRVIQQCEEDAAAIKRRSQHILHLLRND